jgi:hypothetical protein
MRTSILQPAPYRAGRRRARGLAPLEFVLWLPVFLLIAALIINLGTMQTWRVRGEIAARNAAWNERWPRRRPFFLPIYRPWQGVHSAWERVPAPPALNPPHLAEPAVRGPLPATFVTPLLDPQRYSAIVGHGRVVRRMPMLRGSARYYNSNDIRHALLDGTGAVREMGLSSNDRRRTKDLYIFPIPAFIEGEP